MRLETILKKLQEIENEKDGKKAREKLKELIKLLDFKIKKEIERKQKHGKAVQHLVGWYLQLWDSQPPESFGRTEYLSVIGKTFRELLVIYENNGLTLEDIKKDYEVFRTSNKTPSFLLGDKSITRFRAVLPQLKQLSKEGIKKWTMSEEYRKPKDEYELPSNLIFSSDEDEDVPF